eukprot:8830905-Alexandrium_andersonii.AAC.1
MRTDETTQCYEALQRILRMLHTCPRCEKPFEVGDDWCAPCDLSVKHRATILCRLLRQPAAKGLMNTTKPGKRM